MNTAAMVKDIFNSIDTKNTQDFIGFMTEDCVFQFGNAPAIKGKSEIEKNIDVFFGSIEGISHSLIESWQTENSLICHGSVTYTRLDKSKLTVPFANILYLKDGLISQYLIYVNNSELY